MDECKPLDLHHPAEFRVLLLPTPCLPINTTVISVMSCGARRAAEWWCGMMGKSAGERGEKGEGPMEWRRAFAEVGAGRDLEVGAGVGRGCGLALRRDCAWVDAGRRALSSGTLELSTRRHAQGLASAT